jgi:thymidylate synthase (FAD)
MVLDITVQLIETMGSDLSVVNAARVSYDKTSDWVDGELSARDEKLIQYLAKHKHTSPFGHAFASFRVAAPVFVARQLVKHKFLRWNEVSRRYINETPRFYEPDWRSKPENSKQGSGGPMEISLDAEMLYHATIRNALTTYDLMIKEGVAPEQARAILPQNMMTSWVWSGSLDAFADMCKLRCAHDTQYETRLVATEIDVVMENEFPVSWSALRYD